MMSRETHTPLPEGRSIRAVNRERRLQHGELQRRNDAERREAIAKYLQTLEKANASVSLSTVLEVVYPKSRIGRFVSLQKDRMIPAYTSHVTGKSTLGGWMHFRKITGRYLLIEEVEGYAITSACDSNVSEPVRAILQDGRIGTLLKPCREGSQTYEYRKTSIHLEDWGDSFERRNCQAVWGPSLRNPDELGIYEAGQVSQDLGMLIVNI